jgi:hypothetical protein
MRFAATTRWQCQDAPCCKDGTFVLIGIFAGYLRTLRACGSDFNHDRSRLQTASARNATPAEYGEDDGGGICLRWLSIFDNMSPVGVVL